MGGWGEQGRPRVQGFRDLAERGWVCGGGASEGSGSKILRGRVGAGSKGFRVRGELRRAEGKRGECAYEHT